MTETSYAIALTFSSDIAEVFDKLRDKYNKYVGYKIEPHITLVYPFTLTTGMADVCERLEEVAKRTKPFTIVLDGIEYFEGEVNVAYVAVSNKWQVKKLYTDINSSLRGLIKVEDIFERYSQKEFTPHMTISDQIPDDVFPTIKKELMDYKLHYECEIGDFSLFSAQNDGVWKRVRVFELSG